MNTVPTTTAAQVPMTPTEERRWGAVAHLGALASMVFSLGLLGFVGSVVLWFWAKDRGPFVRAHAANAVNVQIVTAIWLAISGVLMFVGIGYVLYPIVIVWSVLVHLKGASRARRGEAYVPAWTPRIFR